MTWTSSNDVARDFVLLSEFGDDISLEINEEIFLNDDSSDSFFSADHIPIKPCEPAVSLDQVMDEITEDMRKAGIVFEDDQLFRASNDTRGSYRSQTPPQMNGTPPPASPPVNKHSTHIKKKKLKFIKLSESETDAAVAGTSGTQTQWTPMKEDTPFSVSKDQFPALK